MIREVEENEKEKDGRDWPKKGEEIAVAVVADL